MKDKQKDKVTSFETFIKELKKETQYQKHKRSQMLSKMKSFDDNKQISENKMAKALSSLSGKQLALSLKRIPEIKEASISKLKNMKIRNKMSNKLLIDLKPSKILKSFINIETPRNSKFSVNAY
jgi:hypothetical protein